MFTPANTAPIPPLGLTIPEYTTPLARSDVSVLIPKPENTYLSQASKLLKHLLATEFRYQGQNYRISVEDWIGLGHVLEGT